MVGFMFKVLVRIMAGLALAVTLLVAACGGGPAPTPMVVAFYGDSITTGQVPDIVRGDFLGVDYAVGGQHSDAPLNPSDKAPVVVLRYGMADAAHGLSPQTTRENLQRLISQIKGQGRRVIVVNVSRTPSGLEVATNAAIADITDVDLSQIDGLTLDGIHPDTAFYAALNNKLHAELVRLLLS